MSVKPFWEGKGVQLWLADNRDVLPQLADGSVDVVITDPPFEAEAHSLQRRQHGPGGRKKYAGITAEPLPFEPIDGHTRRWVAGQLARLVQRWLLTFCQIEAAPTWRCAYEACGLTYRRTCIWVKPDGMPQFSGDRPGMGYETLVAMHPRGRSRWNGGGRHGVWVECKGQPGGERHMHPTQKPLPLMRELVRLFSNPDEIILDPFAGVGTTGVAAIAEGRRAILVERDERYAHLAAVRLERGDTAARQPLQGLLNLELESGS